jgi:glycosyltransferase involved in cell wall biosynthesis
LVLIVDDASTDESISIAREYVRDYDNVELLIHKENSGSAVKGWNYLIDNATTDYVMCLSSDDAMLNGFTKYQSGADWIWGDLVVMDEFGKDRLYWDYATFPKTPQDCLERIKRKHENYPPFAGAMFRTKWLHDNDLHALAWPDGFKGYEDVLWSWNWLRANPKLEYHNMPWCRYRRHLEQGTFVDKQGAAEHILKLVDE